MASLVDRIRVSLGRDDREGALELLVLAWQSRRAPALADLVDAIDAADPRCEPHSGSTRAWLAAAKKATHRERGRLVAGIQGRSMIDTVRLLEHAQRWSDPRFTHALVTVLTALPWVGARSHEAWRDIFAMARRHADPRFAELTAGLSDTWHIGGDAQRWFANQLAAVRAAIPGPIDAAGDRGDSQLVALARELRATLPSAGPVPATAEALLAAIHENPDDDAPRLVYADWLQERGDPRGEFIASQLRTSRDAAAYKRERALLKQHRKTWLGPLAPVLRSDVTFRRGFPVAAIVTFRTQRDVERHGALSAWATLEELEWGHQLVRTDQRRWARFIGPAMANVAIARRPLLEHLLAASAPWHRLHTLELDANELTSSALPAIAMSPLFPALTDLAIVGWGSEPSWLAGLARSPGRCPPHLAISAALSDPDRDDWLAAAAVTELVSLTLRQYGGLHHRFTRETPRGAFTRLDVEVHPRQRVRKLDPLPRPLVELTTALKRLPPGRLTHFDARIQIGPELVPATPVLAVGRSKLRR